MDKLYEYFLKLLQETNSELFRYVYNDINWDSRMIGITGPRGAGKTTSFSALPRTNQILVISVKLSF